MRNDPEDVSSCDFTLHSSADRGHIAVFQCGALCATRRCARFLLWYPRQTFADRARSCTEQHGWCGLLKCIYQLYRPEGRCCSQGQIELASGTEIFARGRSPGRHTIPHRDQDCECPSLRPELARQRGSHGCSGCFRAAHPRRAPSASRHRESNNE